MKKLVVLLTLSLVMCLASVAFANHWYSLEPTIDCYSWSAVAHGDLGQSRVDIAWEVTLTKDGVLVDSWSGAAVMLIEDPYLYVGADFGEDLCGVYTLSGYFEMSANPDKSITFNETFTCECEPPDEGCFLTPGYWKNHPEDWLLTDHTLGNFTFAEIFDMPTKGNMMIIMAQHLIAAKLNVANGQDTSIQGAIDDGDAWVAMYPNLEKPAKADRGAIEDVKDLLCDYNEQGCEEEEDDCDDVMMTDMQMQKAPPEETTWGTLKSTFR